MHCRSGRSTIELEQPGQLVALASVKWSRVAAEPLERGAPSELEQLLVLVGEFWGLIRVGSNPVDVEDVLEQRPVDHGCLNTAAYLAKATTLSNEWVARVACTASSSCAHPWPSGLPRRRAAPPRQQVFGSPGSAAG
jgi:hypothetical protein